MSFAQISENPTPCYMLRVLLHDIESDANLWRACFHDLISQLIGLNALDYDSLPKEDAKYHALDDFRGGIMRATIQKSVSASYTNFVMTDGDVLFTQKDMETAAEMTRHSFLAGAAPIRKTWQRLRKRQTTSRQSFLVRAAPTDRLAFQREPNSGTD